MLSGLDVVYVVYCSVASMMQTPAFAAAGGQVQIQLPHQFQLEIQEGEDHVHMAANILKGRRDDLPVTSTLRDCLTRHCARSDGNGKCFHLHAGELVGGVRSNDCVVVKGVTRVDGRRKKERTRASIARKKDGDEVTSRDKWEIKGNRTCVGPR